MTLMAGRGKKVDDDWCTGRSLWFCIRNFAGTARFHGDSRSQRHTAESLVRRQSADFRQTQAAIGERDRIHHHAGVGRSANTGLADGKLIPEVLVIGLKLTAKATGIPNEVIDLIAGQRKSGIVFVCVRDVPFEGSTREECAFAVRPRHTGACRAHARSIRYMPATGSRRGGQAGAGRLYY